MRLTIRLKLLLSFGLLVLMMAGLGVTALLQMGSMNTKAAFVDENIIPTLNAAVLVTEEGTKGVESGARQAGPAGQVIHRIAAEVEGGAQANVQMAAAAQQQTAGMEQIGQAMGSIQQATTQALASTRQA